MLVADSSVWIDFFRGATNPACEALEGWLMQGDAQVLMPDLVLFEVVRGFRSDREMRDAIRVLAPLGAQPIGGEPQALRAAERYRALRAAGWTVRSNVDALVASYCIDHDHILLHRDRDFLPYVERYGLRVWPLAA